MFEIGWSELLVIAVVAIIVVGPKDLPRMMRTFGHYLGKLRRMAGDFQRQFEEAVRESELEEVRQAMQSVRDATPSLDLKAPIDKPLMLPKQSGDAVDAATPTAARTKPKPKSRAKPKPVPNTKGVKTAKRKASPERKP